MDCNDARRTGQKVFRLFLSPSLVIAAWMIPNAWCDNYQYNADIPRLGQGFSKLTPTEGFQSCFDPQKISEAHGPAVATAFNLETQLIDSRNQMYTLLHIDAELAARTLAASGKVNAEFDQETSLESTDIVWVMRGEQRFTSSVLAGDTVDALTTAARDLLGNPSMLYSACGFEYVKTQQRAAMIAAVFTLHNSQGFDRRDVRTHVEGGASWTGADVSFNANFRQFMQQAQQSRNVTVRVFGFGGGGITALSGILSADNLDALRAVLATYIRQEIVPQKAVPISFTTAGFSSFLRVRTTPLPPAAPDLPGIYLAYGDVESKLGRTEEILRGRSGDYAYLSDSDVTRFGALRTKLLQSAHQLYGAANTCMQGKACAYDLFTDRIVWPNNPELHCTDWRPGNAGGSSCYACKYEVSFSSEVSGKRFTGFTCSHMPPHAVVEESFDGFIVISTAATDNKVWNANVAVRLDGPDQPCNECADIRVTPGLGAPGVDQSRIAYNREWKFFHLHGSATLAADTASAVLVLTNCQTGPSQAPCDTAPPGGGAPSGLAAQNGYSGSGFPSSYTGAPAVIKLVVRE